MTVFSREMEVEMFHQHHVLHDGHCLLWQEHWAQHQSSFMYWEQTCSHCHRENRHLAGIEGRLHCEVEESWHVLVYHYENENEPSCAREGSFPLQDSTTQGSGSLVLLWGGSKSVIPPRRGVLRAPPVRSTPAQAILLFLSTVWSF